MESAIDTHLKCPRSLSRRVADDYAPPYPAYVARADPGLRQVVMAYFGVQSQGAGARERALAALRGLVGQFAGGDVGPGHHDLVEFRDSAGYDNLIAVAYWDQPERYARWTDQPSIEAWWNSPARLEDGLGYFREVMMPRVEQFETLYAFCDALPGVGAIMGRGISGEIEEHGYWGSMRDRFPASQTDWMSGRGGTTRCRCSMPARSATSTSTAIRRRG
jgi:aldoxime dehydratase